MKRKSYIALIAAVVAASAMGVSLIACGDPDAPPAAATYTLEYSAGEGSGTLPGPAQYAAGAQITLDNAESISHETKDFKSWLAGETEYAAGATFTMPEHNVTFIAQWKDKTTPGGDTITSASAVAADYSAAIIISEEEGNFFYGTTAADEEFEFEFTYVLTGTALTITFTTEDAGFATKVFNGTYDGATLSITVVYKGASYVMTTPAAPSAPTVSFDANGGSGAAPEASFAYDENSGMYKLTLPANTFTPPADKEFKCWNAAVYGDRNPGTSVMVDAGETVVFKAIWQDTVVSDFVTEDREGVKTLTAYNGDAVDLVISADLGIEAIGMNAFKGNTALRSIDFPESVKYIATGALTKAANLEYVIVRSTTAISASGSWNNSPMSGLTRKLIVYAPDALVTEAANEADRPDQNVYGDDDWSNQSCTFLKLSSLPAESYTITFAAPSGATGSAPNDIEAPKANDYKFTLPDNPYTLTGWTFAGWQVEGKAKPQAVDTTQTASKDLTVTAVFKKEYVHKIYKDPTEYKASLVLYTNADADMIYTYPDDETPGETVVEDQCLYTYVEDEGVISFYLAYRFLFGTYSKLETPVLQDGFYYLEGDMFGNFDMLFGKSYTASDGTTTLTFDGKGGAKLGSNNGTYTITATDPKTVVELTFGSDTKSVTLDAQGNINAVITAGGTEYTFGKPSVQWSYSYEVGEGEGAAPAAGTVMTAEGKDEATVTLDNGSGLAKTGYTFAGWKIKDGGDTVYKTTAKITQNGTVFVSAWTEEGGSGGGDEQPDEPVGYLKEYVGATSASTDAVKFGYNSAAEAEADNKAIKLMNNTASAERTFYKATVNRNYSNKLIITITANTGSVSSPKNADGQDIVIEDTTPNQIVYITNASYTERFVIKFAKNSDGKRTITITNGSNTVTWVEMTA